MTTLESVCELAWLHCFPKADDETAVTKDEFIEAGRLEMATQLWLSMWNERNADASYEVPSYLLSEYELPVVDNQVDLSCISVLRGLPKDIWLRNIGGLTCDCEYVKTNQDLSSLLCDEDSRGHGNRTYFPFGTKIVFPQGTHVNPIKIIVANMGENVDTSIEVDEIIGNAVRDKLVEKFLGKSNQVDTTNNNTPLT